MKITFLIGNGFDISLGVPTSYADFYKWYLKQPAESKHIEDFKNEIADELQKDIPDEERTWADFEKGLGMYTAQFTPETVGNYLDCYEDAQKSIATYLIDQEKQFQLNTVSNSALSAFRNSILNFYAEVSDHERQLLNSICNNVKSESREISFISFNYTGILEKIIGCFPASPLTSWSYGSSKMVCNINSRLIYVHGTTQRYPIIGVNDETQIANKELLATSQFRSMLIKAEAVSALGELWHRKAEEQISGSRIICIFGMSLGMTDAKWWRKISVWLKGDNNRHVVLYWYDKNPPNGISIRRKLECEENTRNLLLSYSDLTSEEKNRIKTRIHVIINTQVFLKFSSEHADEENKVVIDIITD